MCYIEPKPCLSFVFCPTDLCNYKQLLVFNVLDGWEVWKAGFSLEISSYFEYSKRELFCFYPYIAFMSGGNTLKIYCSVLKINTV